MQFFLYREFFSTKKIFFFTKLLNLSPEMFFTSIKVCGFKDKSERLVRFNFDIYSTLDGPNKDPVGDQIKGKKNRFINVTFHTQRSKRSEMSQ
jgi:hypothetical protein